MVEVECWVLKKFEDLRITFMALVQLGIINGEVIDAEKCTVKHSQKWLLLSRCLLSGLSDLMPGQGCERCGKRLIEGKVQRALSGMPAQLIERVNVRITQMKRDMESEARLFSHLEKLLETKICSANEKINSQLRIWEALHEEVEELSHEVKALKSVLEANSASLKGDISEVKNLLEQQGQKIEALKEELAKLYAKVTEGMEKIDLRFYEEKMAHTRMELQQIGARFHSAGVRGSRIPPMIREIHPG